MPRILAAVLTLAVLAVPSPGRAFAGPPEGASGRMVLDKVEDVLRRYYATRNADTRAALLRTLATFSDRRVFNALADALNDREQVVRFEAARLMVVRLCNGNGHEEEVKPNELLVLRAKEVWRQYQRQHELDAEKARRAKELPQ
jgi:HEAT repeat protein